MRQIHEKRWVRVQRATQDATESAARRGEPFAVVEHDGSVFVRPLTRALHIDHARIVVEVFPSVTR